MKDMILTKRPSRESNSPGTQQAAIRLRKNRLDLVERAGVLGREVNHAGCWLARPLVVLGPCEQPSAGVLFRRVHGGHTVDGSIGRHAGRVRWIPRLTSTTDLRARGLVGRPSHVADTLGLQPGVHAGRDPAVTVSSRTQRTAITGRARSDATTSPRTRLWWPGSTVSGGPGQLSNRTAVAISGGVGGGST